MFLLKTSSPGFSLPALHSGRLPSAAGSPSEALHQPPSPAPCPPSGAHTARLRDQSGAEQLARTAGPPITVFVRMPGGTSVFHPQCLSPAPPLPTADESKDFGEGSVEAPGWATHPEVDILRVCSGGLPRTHSVLDCGRLCAPPCTPPFLGWLSSPAWLHEPWAISPVSFLFTVGALLPEGFVRRGHRHPARPHLPGVASLWSYCPCICYFCLHPVRGSGAG